MNGKPGSIVMVARLMAAGRIRGVGQDVTPFTLRRAVLCAELAPLPEPGLWLGLGSADDRAGEFWETLSYVAIWLCGLSGIGLCFR